MDDDPWLSKNLKGTDNSLSHPFIFHCNPDARLLVQWCLLLAFPFFPAKWQQLFMFTLYLKVSVQCHTTL